MERGSRRIQLALSSCRCLEYREIWLPLSDGARSEDAKGAPRNCYVRIHYDFRILQCFRVDSSNWTFCFGINRQITLQPTAMTYDDETSLSGQNHQRCQKRDATGPIRSRSIRPLKGDCTRHVILGDTDRARSSFRCVYTSMVSY